MNAPWRTAQQIGVMGTDAALPGEPITTEALIAQMESRFGFRGGRVAQSVAGRLARAMTAIGPAKPWPNAASLIAKSAPV